MFIDPFRLCIALLPLGLYCLALGLVNVSSRPHLITGARDLAVLGVALSGVMAIGPLELFMPAAAAAYFGPYVWLLLLALYGLGVTFAVLLSRPRLVIYNITTEQLRPILVEVVAALDRGVRWAGNSLVLPQLGVEMHLESLAALRNVSLIANGHQQDLRSWQRLEQALRTVLQETRVPRNPRAGSLIGFAVLLFIVCLCYGVVEPGALVEGYRDMLGGP